MNAQRAAGAAGFVLVLMTLALPWMSFSVGCTGNLAPKKGVDLLHGSDTHISVHNGDDQAEGTIHIEPQPAVWAVLVLATGGAASFAVERRRGFWLRAGIAAAGLGVVAWYAAALINGSPGVTFAGDGAPPETQVRAGEIVGALLLVLTLLLNATLPFVFPASWRSRRGRERVLRLAGYAFGIAAATCLGTWGVAVLVTRLV